MSSSKVVNTSEQESNEWAQTPWRKLEKYVFQLQKRIYRARQRGDWKTVRGLQRILRRSRAAKTLAVRGVTQDNDGKKTPGIDGVAKLNPKERLEMVQTMNLSDKARPVRRVWIPKPGKTEMRPLGIPTMMDRANLQLLHRHCHHDITRTMLHDKAKHVEEPCAAKVASTVLKPSGRGDPLA